MPAQTLLRRIAWWPVSITALVLLTAAFAVDPVRDAVTRAVTGDAHLDLSLGYVALAPLSNVLDTLTLLTVGQHVALLVWAIVIFAAWRITRFPVRRRAGTATMQGEVIAVALLLLAIFVVYAAVALLPRPMAAIAPTDDNVIALDFHAHTKYSHDGRSGWTEEDVRDWHRGAGYDATYITDHATFEGAERGIAANPSLAGEGTTIFQGLEAFYKGEHVLVLSAGRLYKGLTTPDLKDIDEQSLALASLVVPSAPVVIQTIPGNLAHLSPSTAPGSPGASAVEIIDGSPRGLTQGRRDHDRIVHLADSLNLALVTGSDNHGYGRAAPGWTLLRIPGWRGMPTDSLSRQIERILRVGRRDATRTIERRVAAGVSPISLLVAPIPIIWRMMTTLSPDERVMWLAWTWGIFLLARSLRKYRVRPSARA